MAHFLKIYDENGDSLEISAHWAICSVCNGEGKHSHNIGCITAEEFEEEWEPEERAAYFSGAYDRRCSECDGTGKVLEPNLDNLTEDELKSLETYCNGLREDRAQQQFERMMGC